MLVDRRTALLGGAALTLIAGLPGRSLAQDSFVARKVNIAGRQRMLSQRIAMAACMARLGVDIAANVDVVRASSDEFEIALNGLVNGSGDLGLEKEEHRSVLAALSRVQEVWRDMSISAANIVSRRTVSRLDLQEIADLNLKVLSRSNVAVKKIVAAYESGDRSNAGLARAIDMAGRQRMLSQKMIKEAALIGLGFRKSDNRDFLSETLTLFDESLFKLMYGNEDDGIPEPPAEVLEKLEQVEYLWLELYPVMDEIATLGRADNFELNELSNSALDLLSMSNQAVGLYELAWTG